LCSPCKVKATSTAPLRKSRPSRVDCRKPACSSLRIADTRRIATSRRSSPARPAASSSRTPNDSPGAPMSRISLNFSSLVALMIGVVPFAATAQGAGGPIKIGLMLPYSGTYAALGNAIENGFKLYVQEQGGKLGGREIQYFKVDDESEPPKATDNVNKLIKRDNVDVLVGTVHSGVALAMAKAAKDNNTLLIIPNAGADAITGPMCGPNIVRSSFSNWQPGYAMGVVAGQKGVKRAMTITWNY